MHCRGGHGRTGTATLTLSRVMQRFYEESSAMTRSETLMALRQQRAGLVETKEQYEYAERYVQSAEATEVINQLRSRASN